MKNNTGWYISLFFISMFVVVGVTYSGIVFPAKATVVSIERNYDFDNITMREYLTFIKEPIPASNKSPRLDKKFNFVIKFKGYLNEKRYREINPDDALWLNGNSTRNAPDEMSGYIFAQNLVLSEEFFKK